MSTPINQVLIEAAAWERFCAAIFRHDLEHSTGSWIEKERAKAVWSAAFLVDEPAPAEGRPNG